MPRIRTVLSPPASLRPTKKNTNPKNPRNVVVLITVLIAVESECDIIRKIAIIAETTGITPTIIAIVFFIVTLPSFTPLANGFISDGILHVRMNVPHYAHDHDGHSSLRRLHQEFRRSVRQLPHLYYHWHLHKA